MKRNFEIFTVYAVKCKDGQYRCVEAVSWKDCKRYCGSDAVSIRKREISMEDHRKLFTGGQEAKRDIYETGAVRPSAE